MTILTLASTAGGGRGGGSSQHLGHPEGYQKLKPEGRTVMAEQYNDGGARERLAETMSEFTEAATVVEDRRDQVALSRLVRTVKAGHGDTVRLLDSDALASGADRALITVCVKAPEGRQRSPRAVVVQRDIVPHPYLQDDSKAEWLATRAAEFRSLPEAFEFLERVRLQVREVLRAEREEGSATDAPTTEPEADWKKFLS